MMMMRKRVIGNDIQAVTKGLPPEGKERRDILNSGSRCSTYVLVCAQVVIIAVISVAMSLVYLLLKYGDVSPKSISTFLRSQRGNPATTFRNSAVQTDVAPKCTSEQLETIQKHLNLSHKNCWEEQYSQQCPVTVATKCFRDSWLRNYYSHPDISIETFLAITLGCDGGYRSVELLRMGTKDSSIDVASWTIALQDATSGSTLNTVCADVPNGSRQVSLLPGSSPVRTGFVYCIEESPDFVDAIGVANVNNKANYATKGLVVHHSRIAGDPGKIYHPKAGSKGPCNTDAQRAENCVSVPVETLDDFVRERISGMGVINVLEITNGYEFDAMIGGINTLKRTEYVLLKFDWRDQWQGMGRSVSTVSTMLNKLGFTCYWAGMEKLWRITSCSLSQYSSHKFWAHIACANRNLAPYLTAEMERLFLKSLAGE